MEDGVCLLSLQESGRFPELGLVPRGHVDQEAKQGPQEAVARSLRRREGALQGIRGSGSSPRASTHLEPLPETHRAESMREIGAAQEAGQWGSRPHGAGVHQGLSWLCAPSLEHTDAHTHPAVEALPVLWPLLPPPPAAQPSPGTWCFGSKAALASHSSGQQEHNGPPFGWWVGGGLGFGQRFLSSATQQKVWPFCRYSRWS